MNPAPPSAPARVTLLHLLRSLAAAVAACVVGAVTAASAATAAGADRAAGSSATGRPVSAAATVTARPVIGGELAYLADAARLTDCATGRGAPVAMDGDWLRAERAYRAAARTPGAPVYVTFEGGLEERPGMQADASEATMVVRRFIHAWPGETCERARADARLVNTYWRIVALGGEDVAPVPGRREPQLRIRAARDDAERGDYAASVGCNAINGQFERAAAALRFTAGAMTRMACPPPLDALERRLLAALARCATARIHANTLELFDARGTSLGLLQAVYL